MLDSDQARTFAALQAALASADPKSTIDLPQGQLHVVRNPEPGVRMRIQK